MQRQAQPQSRCQGTLSRTLCGRTGQPSEGVDWLCEFELPGQTALIICSEGSAVPGSSERSKFHILCQTPGARPMAAPGTEVVGLNWGVCSSTHAQVSTFHTLYPSSMVASKAGDHWSCLGSLLKLISLTCLVKEQGVFLL